MGTMELMRQQDKAQQDIKKGTTEEHVVNTAMADEAEGIDGQGAQEWTVNQGCLSLQFLLLASSPSCLHELHLLVHCNQHWSTQNLRDVPLQSW